jgi:hypothetical protein
VTWLQWLLIALGALLAGYAGFVACLVRTGRREDARAVAGFMPDRVVLFPVFSVTTACRGRPRPDWSRSSASW